MLRTAPSDRHMDIQHEKGGFTMRPRIPRTLLLLALAAPLGAAVTVLPALAASPSASSEVKLEVAQNCYIAGWPCWNPKGNPEASVSATEVAPFKIAQGGTISFEDNDSQAPTDVVFKGTAPTCTGVVEAPPTKTDWSGTCTFATAGEYTFESEGLFKGDGADYTKYKVIVEAGASSTTPTTTTSPGSGSTTTSPQNPGGSGSGSASGSPLSDAPRIDPSQRGTIVTGSLQIAQAGTGDRLEIDLIAATASLAKAGHGTQVIGRFVNASVSAGVQSFSVKLDAKARRALKRHHRLALKVKITLTPVYGEATSVTKSVILHAGG